MDSVSSPISSSIPATANVRTRSHVVWRRRVASWSRWLHIYVSMTSFVIVFFFAVTGLTLNHAEWFSGSDAPRQVKGSLNSAWTNTGTNAPAKDQIVEFLRRQEHVSGALSDFQVDDAQCSVAFKGPGYSADVFIDRQSGRYELAESRLGLVAIINDLHKGRDTGAIWKTLLDISAAVLTFISLTGLILIYFVHKHRLAGIICLLAGGALACLAYFAWVP